MSREFVVFVTAPGAEAAREIGKALVTERLAACVNLVPLIESIYRWDDEVTSDSESLLIIKTTDDSYQMLEHRIKQMHEYSVPEIIAFEIAQGSDDYIAWIRKSTTST
ncbi:MAG: divalent-cation tolerance protein CutA [Blastocatellia bacterium]